MRRIKVTERRQRLIHRQLATADDASVEDVVSAVGALHATDPATVYLSVLARAPHLHLDDVTRALYADRTLVRMLAMRRTMFVVPLEDAPTFHDAASLEVAARIRRRLVKQLTDGPTDPPIRGDVGVWIDELVAGTVRAVDDLGNATGAQISAAVPALRTAILPTTDKKWDVRRNITTQVLTLAGAEGRIVRVEPRGTWTSRHHAWEPASRWWADGIPVQAPGAARTALVRRWLEVFGPGTVADLQWWTGWSLGTTRSALSGVETIEVDLDGASGHVLADDVESDQPVTPTAHLLPALDATAMGWKDRDWFLGPHRGALFDRMGNIGPTIWWEGAIVGGWAVSSSGDLATRLLEDIGSEGAAAVDRAADSLHDRLEGAVVVPSFRTPLERDLAG